MKMPPAQGAVDPRHRNILYLDVITPSRVFVSPMFLDFLRPSDFFEYTGVSWFDAEHFPPCLNGAGWVMFLEGKIAGVFVELCRGFAHCAPPLLQGLLHAGAIAQAELPLDETIPASIVLPV